MSGSNVQTQDSPVQTLEKPQVPPQDSNSVPPQNTDNQEPKQENQTETKKGVTPEYSKMQSEIRKTEVQPLRTQVTSLSKDLETERASVKRLTAQLEAYKGELDAPYTPEQLKDAQTHRQNRVTITTLTAERDALKDTLDKVSAKLNEYAKKDYARDRSSETGIPVEVLIKGESPEAIDLIIEAVKASGATFQPAGQGNQQTQPQGGGLPAPANMTAGLNRPKSPREIQLEKLNEAKKRAGVPIK